MSGQGASVAPVLQDPRDRRAIALASLASLFLLVALVMPIRWVVVLLVLMGVVIGAVAAASSLRRMTSHRA